MNIQKNNHAAHTKIEIENVLPTEIEKRSFEIITEELEQEGIVLAENQVAALEKAGLNPEHVDWLVPHQANMRIIESTAKRMQLPMEKVVLTVADHGNTSAASIPLALSVANSEGRFKPGQILVAEAIGGGLAWGSVVLRW